MALTTLVASACSGSEGEADAGPTTRLTLLPTTTQAPATTTTTTLAPTTTVALTLVTAPPSTASTTSLAPTTTEPVDPLVEALELSDEGIGAAVFSGDPEGVVTYLSSFAGPPTEDTGWVDPFSISACAGTELRVVSWGSLRLTFGDVSPILDGRRHFFAYTYGSYSWDPATSTVAVVDQTPVGLRTDTGVGLGTTVVALEGAYPGLELNPSDDFFPETYFVNDNMRGALSGLADDSTVVSIIGGADCADPT